jgi:hypothetical protein
VLVKTRAAPAVLLVHAVLSFPEGIRLYARPHAWAIRRIPYKQALRLRPERQYLEQVPGYHAAMLVENHVPAGDRVFSLAQIAQAYTSREILVGGESNFCRSLQRILWTPIMPDLQPVFMMRFRFPAKEVIRLRLVQTGAAVRDQWSITELRPYLGNREIPRTTAWKLRAYPNPWEIEMAFDNSPLTRWSSRQAVFPGMFLDVEFGRPERMDTVLLRGVRDQDQIHVRLDAQEPSGQWVVLADPAERFEGAPPLRMREMAADEFLARGIRYVLLPDGDPVTDDFYSDCGAWRATQIASDAGYRLYRFEGKPVNASPAPLPQT